MSDSLNVFDWFFASLLLLLKSEQYSDAKICNAGEIKQHLLLEAAKITHLAFIQELLLGKDLGILKRLNSVMNM